VMKRALGGTEGRTVFRDETVRSIPRQYGGPELCIRYHRQTRAAGWAWNSGSFPGPNSLTNQTGEFGTRIPNTQFQVQFIASKHSMRELAKRIRNSGHMFNLCIKRELNVYIPQL
jgi:hypothetical protein